MTTMSPEQYASRVQTALLQRLKHSEPRLVSQMPSPDEAATLIMQTRTAPTHHPLRERIGPVWTSTRTREALGLKTRQALSSRRSHGSVLGLTTGDGKVFYPVSQFRQRGSVTEVDPLLVPVLKILKDIDSWTVAAVLRSPDPDLGMSAVDWARQGKDGSRLEQWAHAVRSELTAR